MTSAAAPLCPSLHGREPPTSFLRLPPRWPLPYLHPRRAPHPSAGEPRGSSPASLGGRAARPLRCSLRQAPPTAAALFPCDASSGGAQLRRTAPLLSPALCAPKPPRRRYAPSPHAPPPRPSSVSLHPRHCCVHSGPHGRVRWRVPTPAPIGRDAEHAQQLELGAQPHRHPPP
ncbi:hypothetical protein PVAP13_6KG315306 [Panicum virgatum]|uniref:Uncharacterized protein n=1 Tax=Panicum virgatum TaxID=38727 RepID=A0A8T0RHP5_PANVG|nr:hypothetical protein PVAP13_6KG315306 [Panicum virgatum]